MRGGRWPRRVARFWPPRFEFRRQRKRCEEPPRPARFRFPPRGVFARAKARLPNRGVPTWRARRASPAPTGRAEARPRPRASTRDRYRRCRRIRLKANPKTSAAASETAKEKPRMCRRRERASSFREDVARASGRRYRLARLHLRRPTGPPGPPAPWRTPRPCPRSAPPRRPPAGT